MRPRRRGSSPRRLVASAFSHGTGHRRRRTRGPEGIAALVAAVADANQKLQDLGAAIQAQQESVNKALVDVQTARDTAAAAQQRGRRQPGGASRTPTPRSPPRSERFDTFAASTYVNGPSASYVTATDPADILDTAADRPDAVDQLRSR